MKVKIVVLLLTVIAMSLSPAASAAAGGNPGAKGGVPARFFGISPQTELAPRDARYMEAGGIGSVRWPVSWGSIQPSPDAAYQWESFDRVVEVASRHGLSIFPFVGGTPPWAGQATDLPITTRDRRHGWAAFLKAAVRRYGPAGGFWKAHGSDSDNPVPRRPIRTWQIWNEANFFYFALPVSPSNYGRLVKISDRAISAVDPRARVILSGLFGHPREGRKKGMPASRFLAALYAIRGIRQHFDGIALHPYAAHVGKMKTLARKMRRVTRRHRDGRVPMYITEMGWGSQNDPEVVAFERGLRGQARQLRYAYRFLLRERRSLRIKATYWFSWKDLAGTCSFCDSAGLFYGGTGFVPKPAWKVFVRFTGGHLSP